jgi:hypothetical protein
VLYVLTLAVHAILAKRTLQEGGRLVDVSK